MSNKSTLCITTEGEILVFVATPQGKVELHQGGQTFDAHKMQTSCPNDELRCAAITACAFFEGQRRFT
jgi:hypothetical protein